ncbi:MULTISPECIES: hypothetical protein [Streptomyces]|uniref:Lipoprotein n=1 Tax=Streptomyces lateritius TaxID=67313 RepID=A0ABW6Y529_9ACTN|nr:hypothetical protein GPZ77_09780 [Streptomyces sp. QHH-9511]
MRTRRAATAAFLAAMVLVTGCGGGGEPEVPEEATGNLEQLAEKAACEPDIQTDAEELRRAKCATPDGAYVLLTFATDRGQREWINEAKDYGGAYLVGRKWTVAGDPRTVARVRERLGGQIETTEPHASHTAGHH